MAQVMQKVKLLAPMARIGRAYDIGTVVELSEPEAQRAIDAGLAEPEPEPEHTAKKK
jgi:hypothetical protein